MDTNADRYTVVKKFGPFSAAHRQGGHQGHCYYLHGHSFHLDIGTRAESLDDNGFVFDFGDWKGFRAYLNDLLDHRLLVAKDDELLREWAHQGIPFLRVSVLPYGTSAEGMARFIFEEAQKYLTTALGTNPNKVAVAFVTVYEEADAYATYRE